MIQTYYNLLGKGSDVWKNIIVVITKATFNEDYDNMGEWIHDMENQKHNFRTMLLKHHEHAYPTVLAISQDITRPNRQENKKGTEQHKYMLAQMDIVYAKALQKFKEGRSMNLHNLNYILTHDSYIQWQ